MGLERWFKYDHLPEGIGRQVSKETSFLRDEIEESLPVQVRWPNNMEIVPVALCADYMREREAGMRKLLEAKDCFVRAGLALTDIYRQGEE